MLKNHFKIAIRNLLKSKTFSLINILGLAFGLCCALLISLWVMDEYAVDNYHTKKDRIYSVISELKSPAGNLYWRKTPGLLAEALMKDVPGIEQAIRVTNSRQQLFKQEHQKLEERGISADPEILTVFDFPLIQGDAASALNEGDNVVISKKLANKLFPNTEALNQYIVIDDWGRENSFKITGVLDDIPNHSTLQFEFIIPFETYLKRRPWNLDWGNYNDQTMVLVEKEADIEKVSEQVTHIIPNYYKSPTTDTDLHLYPFKDLYLLADLENGLDAEGRIIYVKIFLTIAIVIMLIACINFMNLSTARAGKRAKEVGVRKTTGASRESLIVQFLGESILIALIGGALALTMGDVLMGFFNELTGKSLTIPYTNPGFIVSIVMICIVTGVLAGVYPALYLSRFNPSRVLKGAVNSGKSLSGLRRALVVLQFTLSITFVVTTMVVYSQLHFIMNKDLGLEKENILYHHLNGIMGNREAYRNELIKISGVRSVTTTNHNPLDIRNSTSSISWKGKHEDEEVYFHVMQTDQNFIETFKPTLLDGKGFQSTYDSSALKVLINEEAAEVMFLEDPVGSRISVWGNEAEVVGLVKNFNHQSLSRAIDPIIVLYKPESTWKNCIAIDGNVNKVISEVEEVYNKFETNYPFDYGFIDQDYEKSYSKVTVMGKLSNIFAFVTIFISCMGLFGLASYMTEQRKKETGIRKVMGASVFGLVTMFTKNFLGLVLLSFAISAPITWLLSRQWLDDFAFKIDIGVQPFIVGGLSAMFIAVATVSYHTIKVATANPVDSLKYE